VAIATKGTIGAMIHVGWRGLKSGIIEKVASLLYEKGYRELYGVTGPLICHKCYEFGDEVEELVKKYGSDCKKTTAAKKPSLDLRFAISQATKNCGVKLLAQYAFCTRCGGRNFSYRGKDLTARQAGILWI
jgi:copper oxidase (laccase) domain-containing protein